MDEIPNSVWAIHPTIIGTAQSYPPRPVPDTVSSHEDKLKWFRDDFLPYYEMWITIPIARLIESGEALMAFIFMACTIDYLSSFYWGHSTKGNVRKAYTEFISEYFPPECYDAMELYSSLRNGLVHLFTIQDFRYVLAHNNSEMHCVTDKHGQVWLNVDEFFRDLNAAANAYFNDVEDDPVRLDKLLQRIRRDGLLGTIPYLSAMKGEHGE